MKSSVERYLYFPGISEKTSRSPGVRLLEFRYSGTVYENPQLLRYMHGVAIHTMTGQFTVKLRATEPAAHTICDNHNYVFSCDQETTDVDNVFTCVQ